MSHLRNTEKVTICNKNFQVAFYQTRVMTAKEEKEKRQIKEDMERNYANCVEGDWFWEEREERKRLKLELKETSREENLINSRKKTMSKMKNLITCNAWQWPKNNGKMFPPIFLTLTFGEEIKDLKTANRIYSKFIQRYNYRLFKTKDKILQYIAVPEFQENGRVHYHCLFFNLPFNPKNYDIAQEVWGNGFIYMKAVSDKNTSGLAKYMSKYLIKNCDDIRLFKKRKYFPSAKLLRPIILKGYWKSIHILESLQRTRPPEKITNKRVEVDFIGVMNFYFCQLEPNENVLDLLPELDHLTQNVLQSEINKEQGKLNL